MQETELLERCNLYEWMNDCVGAWFSSIKTFSHSFIQFHIKTSLALLYFFVSCSAAFGQVYPDTKVDSLLSSGIEKIILHSYDDAVKIFITLEKEYPDIPLGKIYLAANEIARSYDLAEPFNSDFIKKKINEATELSEKLLDADNKNIWNYYFLALAKGYDAYFDAVNGDWLSAFGTGITSVNIFEEILNRDEKFYDALIAIGTYKYWKSRKMEFLNWLPFVTDGRSEGIKLLKESINKNSYNTYLAANSLIWIYIDKHEYSEAIKIGEAAVNRYPESRIFKRGLARAYEDVDKQKSISYYKEILNSFLPNEKSNQYNEIVLKHHIAQQYAQMGEYSKAIQLCNEILNIKTLSNFIRNKLGNRLERVQKLKNDLSR